MPQDRIPSRPSKPSRPARPSGWRLLGVILGIVAAMSPSAAFALAFSPGPSPDVLPFVFPMLRVGPDGAQINIVKYPETFGLSGVMPDGTPIRVGQTEPG